MHLQLVQSIPSSRQGVSHRPCDISPPEKRWRRTCFQAPTVSPLVTSLFVLQRVYDAVQLAEDVGKKINSEFSAIIVEVTDPFKDIWDKSQLDEVYYDARSLPASVTEYLIMNIKLPRRQFRFTPIILD